MEMCSLSYPNELKSLYKIKARMCILSISYMMDNIYNNYRFVDGMSLFESRADHIKTVCQDQKINQKIEHAWHWYILKVKIHTESIPIIYLEQSNRMLKQERSSFIAAEIIG